MSNIESGIPVLTEVLQTVVYGVDVPERRLSAHPGVTVAANAEMTAMALPDASAGASTVSPLDAASIARIEDEVSERVLQRLLEQIDLMLEERIRDSLADTLQTAVDDLACQLRHGLKQAMETTLASAVRQELQNLQHSNIKYSA